MGLFDLLRGFGPGAAQQFARDPWARTHLVVESVDPSIPLDRVPYFSNDLVRLAVVAGAMVVLLGAGAVTIPQLIK